MGEEVEMGGSPSKRERNEEQPVASKRPRVVLSEAGDDEDEELFAEPPAPAPPKAPPKREGPREGSGSPTAVRSLSPGQSQQSGEGATEVLSPEEFAEWLRAASDRETRKCVMVHDRAVLVLMTAAKTVHCVDALCGHQGGRLILGDIEDAGETTAVKCPRHGRRFCLKSGAQVGSDGAHIDDHQLRIHKVVHLANGGIGVHLDVDPPAHLSDAYCDTVFLSQTTLSPSSQNAVGTQETQGTPPKLSPGQSIRSITSSSFRARQAIARRRLAETLK